jgi:ribosomal protein S18 acetylase RimI-like enzyme
MKIRTVEQGDALAMSRMLQQLVDIGKRTAPADEAFVLANYIGDPDNILCSVCEDDACTLLGFQVLKLATPGNRFGTPDGWGIIGTHVSPLAARRGVGSKLFKVTKAAAIAAGLDRIEAFIGTGNAEGQAYYERMGFRTYRLAQDAVCKCIELT